MQNQLVCNGCRSVLVYPRGATNVCCAICNIITSVPPPAFWALGLSNMCFVVKKEVMHHTRAPQSPPSVQPNRARLGTGMEMAQLVCGNCHTLLMYARGAASVRCSCCNTTNVARSANQVAHVNCGQCRTTLMYPYGAPSVKCAICHYVTSVEMGNTRPQTPANRTSGVTTVPSSNCSKTIVVENPMSRDAKGKLVSNVVVGVVTDKMMCI